MNNKSKGKLLMRIGSMLLVLKLIEQITVSKGCFGYAYLYEGLTWVLPIVLIIIGIQKSK